MNFCVKLIFLLNTKMKKFQKKFFSTSNSFFSSKLSPINVGSRKILTSKTWRKSRIKGLCPEKWAPCARALSAISRTAFQIPRALGSMIDTWTEHTDARLEQYSFSFSSICSGGKMKTAKILNPSAAAAINEVLSKIRRSRRKMKTEILSDGGGRFFLIEKTEGCTFIYHFFVQTTWFSTSQAITKTFLFSNSKF